jgi:hypothetical protein
MWRRVSLEATGVSEEPITFIFRVKRSSELGITLTVNSHYHSFLASWFLSSKCWRQKFRVLQEPKCNTSQKQAFFIVTAMETSAGRAEGISTTSIEQGWFLGRQFEEWQQAAAGSRSWDLHCYRQRGYQSACDSGTSRAVMNCGIKKSN